MSGIRRLEELTASNPECISNDVHLVALSLIAEVFAIAIDFRFFIVVSKLPQFVIFCVQFQIKNLRSQVSRAAIQCVSKLFQYCAKYMEQVTKWIITMQIM